MDFSLTEQQEILKKFAKDFLSEKYTKKVIKELEKDQGHSPEIWSEMASLGWTGLPIPERYDGAGMTFLDLAVLLEEMGRTCAISPYLVHVVFGGLLINYFGNDDQKKEYLPMISSGSKIFSSAFFESGACNPDMIKTRGVPKGKDWVINGTKLFVPYGQLADYLLCTARTDNKSNSKKSLTLFIIDSNTAGIERKPMYTRTEKLCEINFKDAIVSSKNILGEANGGFDLIERIMETYTAATCCYALGIAQRVIDMTVDYAKERVQYGRPIGSFQAIHHHSADMLIDLFGIRVSAYKAAWMVSQNLPCAKEVAIAKVWANQASDRIISLSHQIHGAIGVTMDYDLHYYTRRLKSFQLNYPDTASCLETVAQTSNL